MVDFRVEGEATLDVSDISRGLLSIFEELNKVDKEVNKLSKDLDKLAGKNIDIDVNLKQPLEDMQMLRRDLDEIDGSSVDVTVDLDAGVAIAELDEIQHMVNSLDRERIDIPVDIDVSAFDELEAGALKSQKAVGFGGAGGGGLIASLVLLGTALIPLSIDAAGLAAGLVGSFTTAGVGIGAFAALAIPTIKKVIDTQTELNKVSEKIKAATTAKELTAALKEQKAILAGLSPEMLNAVANLKKFKDEYAKTAKYLEAPTLKIFSGGLKLVTQLLYEATPIALNVAGALQYLIDKANQGVKTDSWKKFFQYVSDNSRLFIVNFGMAVGNFITGVANMIVAFDPLSKMVSNGLLDMSTKFLNWSKTLETNQGFQNFIKYVQENTPKAWAFIQQLFTVLWSILTALEPLGKQVLDFVTDVLAMANAFKQAHPDAANLALKIGLIAAALSPIISLVGPIISGVMGVAGAFGGLGGAIAGLLPEFAVLSGPAGLLVAAAAALVAIGAALALTNPKAREAGGLFDTLKQTWDAVVQTGTEIWHLFQLLYQTLKDSGAVDQFTQAFQHLAHAFQGLLPIIEVAAYALGGTLVIALIALGYALNTVATAVDGVATVVGYVVRKIVDFFQWLYDVLVGHSIIPDLINRIKSLFTGLISWLAGWGGKLVSSVTGFFSKLVSNVLAKANQIKSNITNAFNNAKSAAASAFSSMVSTVSSKMASLYSTVVSKGGQVVGWFKSLPGKIVSAVGNLGGLLVHAGASLIQGLISGVESKAGALLSKMSALASKVKNFLPGSPVKEGPLKAWNDGSPGKELVNLISGGVLSNLGKLQTTMNRVSGLVQGTPLAAATSLSVGSTVAGQRATSTTFGSGQSSAGIGSQSNIGVYVAPGAIQVNGGGSAEAGQQILTKLTRIARFGQFAGGTAPSGI